jgi:uncharacterized membrane protein YsdA (DUF1294 family)
VGRRSNPFRITMIVAGALALGVALMLRFGLALGWPWAFLGAINVVTFAVYFYDKSVAGGTATRVPEAALHLLAVVGGSPAALAAQQLLRHKTAKRSFQVMYWCIVGGQVALLLLVWWF